MSTKWRSHCSPILVWKSHQNFPCQCCLISSELISLGFDGLILMFHFMVDGKPYNCIMLDFWVPKVPLTTDTCDTNLPPTNTKFQHSSMMVSLSSGNLAPNKVPCAYRLNTNKPKYWQSLCDTCNNSCVYTTRHAVLLIHLQCFWHVGLATGLKSLTKHYMTSRTMHWTQWSSNHINRDHDSSFGFRSCQNMWLTTPSVQRLLYIYRCSPSLLKQTPTE